MVAQGLTESRTESREGKSWLGWAGQDYAALPWAGLGWAGLGRAGQGSAWGRAGQDRAEYKVS